MRTLEFLPENKQRRIALAPEAYDELRRKIQQHRKSGVMAFEQRCISRAIH